MRVRWIGLRVLPRLSIASEDRKEPPDQRFDRMILVHTQQMRIFGPVQKQEVLRDAAVIIARVADDFGHGTFTVIEITRQAGVAGQMRRVSPLLVVDYS